MDKLIKNRCDQFTNDEWAQNTDAKLAAKISLELDRKVNPKTIAKYRPDYARPAIEQLRNSKKKKILVKREEFEQLQKEVSDLRHQLADLTSKLHPLLDELGELPDS